MSETLAEIKQLGDDLRSTWEDFKQEHSTAIAEAKQLGDDARAETNEVVGRVDGRLDEIEAQMRKAAIEGEKAKARGNWRSSEKFAAFGKLLRGGPKALTPEEAGMFVPTDGSGNEIGASLIVSDDTEGGFLAPDEFVPELIKGIVEFSPIREIARVRTTIRRSIMAPKRTQTAAAVWADENDAAAETQNPKFGQEELGTQELRALCDISRQDLEDTAFDLEGYLAEEWAEQFGVTEGAAHVGGNGVNGKPEGFLVFASNGVGTVTSNTNDALASDDFIDLEYALKDAYARNGTYVMHRTTIKTARKLKDADNQYLWQPGMQSGPPATLNGRPYVEATDMPVIANGALAVAFGDFRRAYWIVDRIVVETLRDPYTQGPSFIRYWARKRTGGQVVLPEALKLLQIL